MRSLVSALAFMTVASVIAVDAPFFVVPGAEGIELTLDRRDAPGEERDALPDTKGFEKPFRLTVELAATHAALNMSHALALHRSPKARAKLAAMVGDEESRRAELADG